MAVAARVSKRWYWSLVKYRSTKPEQPRNMLLNATHFEVSNMDTSKVSSERQFSNRLAKLVALDTSSMSRFLNSFKPVKPLNQALATVGRM